MMVRKRGPFDRIEKVVNKKRSKDAEETSNESPLKKEKNMLNDHILNLYRKDAASYGEPSSNHSSNQDESKTSGSDIKHEQFKNATSSKESRKSIKIIEKKKSSGFSVKHPTITFNDVAGLDDIAKKLLRICFRIRDKKSLSALKENKCVLLHGPSGCGKTHLVHALAGSTGLPLLEVRAIELISGISGESESRIRDVFEEALRIAPCILFIDDIEAIGSKISPRDGKGMEKRMVIQLWKSLEAFEKTVGAPNMVFIGATNQLDSIDPYLLNRIHYTLAVKLPDEKARLMILKVLTKDMDLPPDFDLEWLAHHTPGYVGSDLYHLVKKYEDIFIDRMYDAFINEQAKVIKCESSTESHSRLHSEPSLNADLSYYKSELEFPVENSKSTLCIEYFKEALKQTVPSSKREGFSLVPNVTWEDVGALKDIKEELQETIIWPIKYRNLYETFGTEGAKGILLYGPKGCGKTLLAKVIANECSINFLSVKGPELLNMYLGESERSVRQCFERARNSAPCVIFFDEIEALCPRRTGSNTNAAAERVVNMLLTEMDGMEDRHEVFVIGATNRLEMIDSAMLRPGRLEKVIYVGLPSPDDRVDILKSLTKNKTKPKISDDVDLNDIGHDPHCNNFSGADLACLIRAASQDAIKEIIKALPAKITDQDEQIKLHNFESAFSKVKPSVTEKDIKSFQQYFPHSQFLPSQMSQQK